MRKHTPGAWSVRDYDGNKNCAVGYGDHRFLIADAAFRSLEESQANARLIAASPELLSALEGVMEWISNWDPNFIHDDDWPSTRDAIRQVIARATGEQS